MVGTLGARDAPGKFKSRLENNRMKTQFTTIPGGHHCLPASNATGEAHAAKSGMFDALKTLKKFFGGARIFAFAGLLTLAAMAAPGADTVDASLAYRPGDTVRVIVTFKEPVSLRYALARFGLQGQLPAAPKVFTSIVDANSFTKLSDHEYEPTGTY